MITVSIGRHNTDVGLVNRFEGSVTSLYLWAVNCLTYNFNKFAKIGKMWENFSQISINQSRQKSKIACKYVYFHVIYSMLVEEEGGIAKKYFCNSLAYYIVEAYSDSIVQNISVHSSPQSINSHLQQILYY